MDLLEQYKQQNPEKFREQKPTQMADEYGREYPAMVALVIRLSGGRIKDARQASYVLLGIMVHISIIALFLFFGTKTTDNPGMDTFKNAPPEAIPAQQ